MRFNEKELGHFARYCKRVDKQGYLLKRGDFNSEHKRRWFELKNNFLFYYKSEDDARKNETPVGVIVLAGVRVTALDVSPLRETTSSGPLASSGSISSLSLASFIKGSNPLPPKPHTFVLSFGSVGVRDYELSAGSEDEMVDWMRAVEEATYSFLKRSVETLRRRVEEEMQQQHTEVGSATTRTASLALSSGGSLLASTESSGGPFS